MTPPRAWIIVDYAWIIMDYAWIIVDYAWIIVDYAWIIVDYAWITTDYSGFCLAPETITFHRMFPVLIYALPDPSEGCSKIEVAEPPSEYIFI